MISFWYFRGQKSKLERVELCICLTHKDHPSLKALLLFDGNLVHDFFCFLWKIISLWRLF